MSEVQSLNARYMLLAFGNGVLKDVSPLDCHALVKLALLTSVPSFAPAGNDVKSAVPCQADEKFVEFEASMAPKLLKGVKNHPLVKLVPLLKSRAGKLVSPLSRHAS